MATRTMDDWQTSIGRVVSTETEDEIYIRGQRLGDLVGKVSFAGMMFVMYQGRLPSPAESEVMDALLVTSLEHGIAPPSMVARCFASYGTSIQAAVGGAMLAFGDRMGGLGEQMARLMVERVAAREVAGEPDDAELDAMAEVIVAEAKAAGGRVPGFGIPLHGADPRAPMMLDIARAKGTYGLYCRFAEALGRALAEARGGRAVPMNLDGVSACVILDLGFSWQSTRMFLLTPRTVSAGAHFLEEQAQGSTWRHVPADRIRYEGA